MREGGEGGEGAEGTRVDGRRRRFVFTLIKSKGVRRLAVEFEAIMSVWAVADFGEVHLPSVFSFIITWPNNLFIKHDLFVQ